MTRPRYDNHSTEFGLWLRGQKRIDSKLGFVATNLDYIWTNYKTGFWMMLEEKRYKSSLTFSQRQQFQILDKAARSDPRYKGFHKIVFEHTSPDDGRIALNNKIVTVDELLEFLCFKRIEVGCLPEVTHARR